MDEKRNDIINKVKIIVHKYDANAGVILFGSRARGDWHEESDWDFLVLTTLPEHSGIKEKVRKEILENIEYKTFDVINFIWHNKDVWEEDYSVTNIYESIQEDGIAV